MCVYIYIYIYIEYKERKKETTSFQDFPNFRQRPSSGDVLIQYIYNYINKKITQSKRAGGGSLIFGHNYIYDIDIGLSCT